MVEQGQLLNICEAVLVETVKQLAASADSEAEGQEEHGERMLELVVRVFVLGLVIVLHCAKSEKLCSCALSFAIRHPPCSLLCLLSASYSVARGVPD